VEPAIVHFAEMFDESRGSTTMRGDENVELAEKRVVRQAREASRCSLTNVCVLHDPYLAPWFSCPLLAL